jgi:hypothetical protein
MLVAAPSLTFPCKSKQLLYSDSTEFWKVQRTANIFTREKIILNTSCTEKPRLHFTCDAFAISFYFNSLRIVGFFGQFINYSSLSIEWNSKHVHIPATRFIVSTGFKYLLRYNVPIIINIS